MTKRTIEEVLTDLIGKKYLEGADFKRNELIDDQLSKVPEALKEIHDLIVSSLPEETTEPLSDINIGWNNCLSDTKANLLKILEGEK